MDDVACVAAAGGLEQCSLEALSWVAQAPRTGNKGLRVQVEVCLERAPEPSPRFDPQQKDSGLAGQISKAKAGSALPSRMMGDCSILMKFKIVSD